MFVGIDGFLNNWCICKLMNEKIEVTVEPNIINATKSVSKSKLTLIDIPIGLSSKNINRSIDFKLRKLLPKGKKSSVFTPPCRKAVYAPNYLTAKEINITETLKSISIQSWNISNKIKEVDEFLIINNDYNLHEAHPEFCFLNLNNNIPLSDGKKTKEGIKKRIQILNNHIKNCEDVLEDSYQKYCHKKIKKDDILDAMSLAVSAMYWKKNNKRKITQIPKKDEKGIALEIYY
jgi:predicted RNase H-like nuclease